MMLCGKPKQRGTVMPTDRTCFHALELLRRTVQPLAMFWGIDREIAVAMQRVNYAGVALQTELGSER